jgi:hypothetical protein
MEFKKIMRHTNGRSRDVYGAAGPPGTMPPNPITHTNGRSRDMYGAWGRGITCPPDRIAHRNVFISIMNCNDQDRQCIVTLSAAKDLSLGRSFAEFTLSEANGPRVTGLVLMVKLHYMEFKN